MKTVKFSKMTHQPSGLSVQAASLLIFLQLSPAIFAQESCTVTDVANNAISFCPDGKHACIQLGAVLQFGDMKIRMAQEYRPEEVENFPGSYIIADIKAPGFEQRGIQLNHNQPQVFFVCNQEVTVVLQRWGLENFSLSVSVF